MSDVTGTFHNPVDFSIEEASGEVDGVHVLGKIKGGNFLPAGMSRNGRWYDEQYRSTVLSDTNIAQKLENRLLFGTISHNIPISDDSLAEGKFSHVITRLNDDGAGEALILDTKAGRLLNTYLRAGSKLNTSTRAEGGYKGRHKGAPKVDTRSYKLESIDFVMEPGFLKAQPAIVESLRREGLSREYQAIYGDNLDEVTGENQKQVNPNKGDLMTKELLEQITKEKTELSSQLENVLDENTQLKKDLGAAEAKNKELAPIEKVARKVEAFGGIETVEKSVEEAKTFAKVVEELGSPEKINTAFDALESALKGYQALGPIEELAESMELLGEYKKQGTLEAVTKVNDLYEDHLEEIKETRDLAAAKKFAESTGTDPEKIMLLIKKGMSKEEIEEFYNVNEDTKEKGKYKKIGESQEFEVRPWERRSLGESLMGSCSK